MTNTNKTKIINIMPHGSCYHYSPDEKPDYWWEKPDRSWLGFWAREWPGLLGEAVLGVSDQYDWEVWQPDFRADKIYTKQLDSGLIYRLFPAKEKIYRLGVRPQNGFFSKDMVLRLKKIKETPIILTLYNTYGFHIPFFIEILKLFGPSKRFPIFSLGLGMFKSPASELMEIHRPLTYLCLLVEFYRQKKLLPYVDIISEMADSSLPEIRKVYKGRMEKLIMGCDFEFWVPVPSPELKKSIRNELNIPQEKTVFFASGNFIPRKQLDKLIEVFRKVSERDDFFLNITGHGDESNIKLLTSLAENLVKQKKAAFHSYVKVDELRKIYWASDVYISVATDEGGPVSVMKAMACGLPVLSTPVGNTAEKMMKHGVGKIVSIENYDEWVIAILEILNKEIPKAIDIKIAEDSYNWPNVAKQYIKIYDDLCKIYF
ncbi:MAG: glycosyltransferase [Candidatus Scalindua sp.]|jgi:glycosyltransferase involved in cell wall biosynthesis|nr:glycosyltransferase [Candidatus Scalindua sp.]MBT5305055.1 glycosyltransferase [Candidatus Scalindua sp.]MBT6048066.1 glycosyltransferase [Candidatus Scalindua sp.]MBT6228719.1 glycosyltransferase [Candidatus Scalindua sp.]MBT6563256.1 glycosyltransferase [Candidatus Scalindua sp.]